MLKKIIIIEKNNKIQCDSEEEVVKLLLGNNYYELTEEEKLERRETKGLANCINNGMKIIKEININTDTVENKFIVKDEMTYILSLLITNNIMILERTDSNIYTKKIDKRGIKDNYIIVNKFSKELLKNYLKDIQRKV